jgi:molybdopterin synthase catalytic subunit
VDEVAVRFGARLAVAHRVGEVPAGEASIAVAASAPHRAEAFAACRFAVDALKRDLPVWKQEIRADGTRRWRDGVAPAIPSAP